MDYETLDKQIAEKKQHESEQKQLEDNYTTQMRKNAEIASIIEAKQKEVTSADCLVNTLKGVVSFIRNEEKCSKK